MGKRGKRAGVGMEKFWIVIKDVEKIWAWIVAGASMPLLLNIASIAPPVPGQIQYLTSGIVIVSVIVVVQLLARAGLFIANKIIIYSFVVMIVSSMVYLGIFIEFTFVTPWGARDVKGFVCEIEAAAIFAAKCPWLDLPELSQVAYEPRSLWIPWSVTLISVVLVVLWLVGFMALSILLGTFVVYQRMRMVR